MSCSNPWTTGKFFRDIGRENRFPTLPLINKDLSKHISQDLNLGISVPRGSDRNP